MKKNRQHTHSM